MTSRSRKSRRTTARSAATANKFRRLVACLTLGATSLCTLSAGAAEPGSMLRWKSRSSVSTPSRTVAEAQSETTLVTYHDANLVPTQTQQVDPLKDPFGDKAPAKTAPRVLDVPAAPADSGKLPTIPPTDQFAVGGGFVQEPCPEMSEFKKIGAITNVIAASPGDLPKECIIDDRVEAPMNHPWCRTVYTWKASGLCHKPLYFEEEALERYGHSTGPVSQPFVSAAHFFGTIPVLAYKMGMDPPGECKYALGYYRPGSCAPYIVPGVPISARAVAAETAAVLGLIYILP